MLEVFIIIYAFIAASTIIFSIVIVEEKDIDQEVGKTLFVLAVILIGLFWPITFTIMFLKENNDS
jgi:hypothetical protein